VSLPDFCTGVHMKLTGTTVFVERKSGYSFRVTFGKWRCLRR
jgi:hypothetical protein